MASLILNIQFSHGTCKKQTNVPYNTLHMSDVCAAMPPHHRALLWRLTLMRRRRRRDAQHNISTQCGKDEILFGYVFLGEALYIECRMGADDRQQSTYRRDSVRRSTHLLR